MQWKNPPGKRTRFKVFIHRNDPSLIPQNTKTEYLHWIHGVKRYCNSSQSTVWNSLFWGFYQWVFFLLLPTCWITSFVVTSGCIFPLLMEFISAVVPELPVGHTLIIFDILLALFAQEHPVWGGVWERLTIDYFPCPFMTCSNTCDSLVIWI